MASPFGLVVEGMDVVDKINAEYSGAAAAQHRSRRRAYLEKNFLKLDKITKATIQ